MKNLTIIDNIQRYVSLNPEEQKAFIEILDKRTVKKKQFIVQPGFICKNQTYVIKGALRSYLHTSSGAEHTLQFAIEDWFISDFNSYIHQVPASFFVEAIEDSVVYELNYQRVENLCKEYVVFERYFRLVAQKSFAFAQRRVLSNLGKSAEERFLEFYNLYPNIVHRVPQYMLASYLGMSPEFLSKIKKRVSLRS